jgi:H+/Cl- antiporter ClcA
MFIGAAGGMALSHLPGLPMIAGAAIGIGAMTAGMLQLPITAVLLTTLFLGSDGVATMPLTIMAVVTAFVLSKWLAGPPSQPAAQSSPQGDAELPSGGSTVARG